MLAQAMYSTSTSAPHAGSAAVSMSVPAPGTSVPYGLQRGGGGNQLAPAPFGLHLFLHALLHVAQRRAAQQALQPHDEIAIPALRLPRLTHYGYTHH